MREFFLLFFRQTKTEENEDEKKIVARYIGRKLAIVRRKATRFMLIVDDTRKLKRIFLEAQQEKMR